MSLTPHLISSNLPFAVLSALPYDTIPPRAGSNPYYLITCTAKLLRRRMEAEKFSLIRDLAEAVGLAERHVNRKLRLAYLAPEVLKMLA